MRRWKGLIVLLLCAGLTATGWVLHAQQRGQGVRIRSENNQEIDLYAASYALLIGVSDYTNGWSDLPGVQTDVREVKAALELHGFQVETLLNPQRDALDRAVRRFISRYGQAERHRLVVYFAGHGHTLKTGDGRDLGYIVPADAPDPRRDQSGFIESAVSMTEVENYAQQMQARHALFVFDSCFSGSLFEANRALPPAISAKTAQSVRQFITAGTADQEVPDKSIFREQFVEALRGEADYDRDGFVTGSELGMFLESKVANYSKGAQTPRWGKIRNARLDRGDLVFTLKKAEPVAPPPNANLADQAFWEEIKNSADAAEFEAYLKRFPNGQYADLARIRAERLRVTPSRPAPTTTPAPARMSATGVALTALPAFTTVRVDGTGKVIERKTQQECWGYVEDLGNGVKLELVEIPAGEFQMGSNESGSDEKPVHRVQVSGFLLGKTEVTQAQWRAVAQLPKIKIDLNPAPAHVKGDTLPVERVSWDEAVEFCLRLSRKTGGKYRLPSEAEWEYAARAGSTTPFAFGATITPELVNYDGNNPYGRAAKGESRQKTMPVGSFPANAWGLFDMHGNVWEWCEDHWHDSYSGAPSDGRAWVDISATGSFRVVRGGGWNGGAVGCRSATRVNGAPGGRVSYLGFRLVRT